MKFDPPIETKPKPKESPEKVIHRLNERVTFLEIRLDRAEMWIDHFLEKFLEKSIH